MKHRKAIGGYIEIGINDKNEVVINLDRDRTGHIVFSPQQAMLLARILQEKASEAAIQAISGRIGL